MTGFLIAGTSSGTGKTTVTLAIAAALRRRGLVVQLFKGGPDFLDTSHHSRIAGRKARNVDTWMLSRTTNVEIFARASRGADVAIVEGMMGLFDGKSGAGEEGSSAEIAKLLRLPVVLVVDAGKSARSVAAMVLGFEMFDAELPLAGVILNRVANERHFEMLEMAIAARCHAPVLGWLPREPAISIPERHLGLRTAQESREEDLEQERDALASVAERGLQMDRLLALRCGLERAPEVAAKTAEMRLRVGVACDAAFSFYYEDNLDLLREHGAEIVFFSPLADRELPQDLDALYLGGGYPELHAEALSANASMLRSVREFAASQRPVYAECGGMMYLATSLTTVEQKTYAMAGVLTSHVEMTPKLRHFGYVEVEVMEDCLLGPKGTAMRGHSFHYSQMTGAEELPACYRVCYSLSGRTEREGFAVAGAKVLASYVHLHFRSNPKVAEHFVRAALEQRVEVAAR